MISTPDDVIICEGEAAVFTCVLNRNSNISNNEVQWHRFINDTDTRVIMVDPDDDQLQNITISTHTGNTLTSSLTITNAVKSFTGYYWVKLPSGDVCNVSLTVGTSMEFFMHKTYNYYVYCVARFLNQARAWFL